MQSKYLLVVAACSASLVFGSCTKEKTEQSTETVDPAPTGAVDKVEDTKPPADKDKAGAAAIKATDERPLPELLDEPRERRLHPDRATASSFLWNDWNKFQENYHPLYLVDDDPKTAWVEGAEGHGDGEWVKVETSKLQAVTKVRLRLRNGYHKSKSLFAKNSRAKSIDVTLLPSKTKKSFDLADSMEWAELVIDQPEGELTAIQLGVKTTYPGSKWEDLCLSDLEVFATSRNIENPEFEKAKLAEVNAWKKERVDAAKFFASKEAASSPLLDGYAVEEGERLEPNFGFANGTSEKTLKMIGLAREHIKGHESVFDRAKAVFEQDNEKWINIKVTPKFKKNVPAVDGLYRSDAYDLFQGMTSMDGFQLPLPGKLAFFSTSTLTIADRTKPLSWLDALDTKPCRVKDRANFFYYQIADNGEKKEGTDIIVVACGRSSERDAYYPFNFEQLLQYNAAGQLISLIDRNSVTTLTWSEGADAKVVGGKRIVDHGTPKRISTLVPRKK